MNDEKRPDISSCAAAVQHIFDASGKRSLIVTGERQSGKTTIIQTITDEKTLPGFCTHMRQDAVRTVWLTENLTGETVQIGRFEQGVMQPVYAGFETLGMRALYAAQQAESAFVLLDEIGFLECNYPQFCAEITRLFDKKRLIAAVRKQALPFLDSLKARSDVCCVNLDLLYETMRL
ncbi:MAG: nucleoside-triphosphatase [Ruthenibacterium sp.]